MTTIAADRRMMACDSQITSGGGTKGVARKVHRIGSALVGVAGTLANCLQFLEWLRGIQHDPDMELPDMTGVEALVLNAGGLWLYTESVYPIRITTPFAAIGSGEQAALGAMYAGATPKEAVRIASKVDAFTGGSIKAYHLRED